jgi:hypothetical protein
MSMAQTMAVGTRIPCGALRLLAMASVTAAAACATTAPDGPPAVAVDAPRSTATRTTGGDDELAMRGEHGSIDRDEAEDAISQHWAELKRCYADAGPAAAFAGGNVSLQFDIALDGRATAVAVQSSRLGNLAVERCLVAVGLGIRFSRPHGHGRASLEYSMEFRSSEDRAVVDLPDEGGPTLRAALLGRIAIDCGPIAPTSGLATTVYVDRRGQVHSAGVAAKSALPVETGACVSGALQRAPLGAAAGQAFSGDALGRATISFTNPDLLAAAAAAAAPARARKPERSDRLATKGRRRRTR